MLHQLGRQETEVNAISSGRLDPNCPPKVSLKIINWYNHKSTHIPNKALERVLFHLKMSLISNYTAGEMKKEKKYLTLIGDSSIDSYQLLCPVFLSICWPN